MDEGIDFRSDNIGVAAPEIIEAVIAANRSAASGYGDDRVAGVLQVEFEARHLLILASRAGPTGPRCVSSLWDQRPGLPDPAFEYSRLCVAIPKE